MRCRPAAVAVAVATLGLLHGTCAADAAGAPATDVAIEYVAHLRAAEADVTCVLKGAAGCGTLEDARAEVLAAQQLSDASLEQPHADPLRPVLLDLGGSDLADAQRRLRAALAVLQVPAGAAARPDSAARDALHDVYRSRTFANLDRQPGASPLTALFDAVRRLLGLTMSHLGARGSLAVAAVVLGVALACALLRLRVTAARRRRVPVETRAVDETDTEWSAATAAAEAGDYREAVRRAFRSALLSASRRGRLAVDAGSTNRELLRRAADDGELAAVLAPAAAGFDRAWYSGREVTESDWQSARRDCESVRRLTPARGGIR